MSSSRRVAIAMILTGLVLWIGPEWWLATRKLVVLDMPVSLALGHIKTEEFIVNLHSVYGIEIEVERAPSLPNLECQMWGCYDSSAIIKAKWVLSSAEHAVLSGASEEINGGAGPLTVVGRTIGGFESSGGRYRLDLDVLSDTSFLNQGNPRLVIEADGTGYNRISRWREVLPILPGILGSVGVALLWLSRPGRDSGQPMTVRLVPTAEVQMGSAFHARRPPRGLLISKLPPFGVYAATVWIIGVFLSLLFLEGFRFTLWPSHGIWVLTSSRSLRTPQLPPRTRPLVLRIDRKGRWFFEGRSVSPEQFPGALKEALSRRADWVVCLDADSALAFGVPAKAMDAIQGLYAKTVLVTPKLRQDRCTGTKE